MSIDSSALRSDAEAIFRAGVDAVSPLRLVQRALEKDGDVLKFKQTGLSVELKRNVRVFGFGKAVIGMAAAVETLFGEHVVEGAISIPVGTVVTMRANHPEFLPSPASVIKLLEGAADNMPDTAAESHGNYILGQLQKAGKDDVVVVLISGGGSALLPVPAVGITLADKHATTKALASKGATINELNTVRKHISRVKGGQLAVAAHPARLFTLILSDVIGDPLDVIASGPTVPDPSSFADCNAIIARLGVADAVPEAVRRHLRDGEAGMIADTPDDTHVAFAGPDAAVHNVLVGTNRIALAAAKRKAEDLGYEVFELARSLEGDARAEARSLVAELERLGSVTRGAVCLLAGGETTCIVKGRGKGGRNQELALVAALEMHERAMSDQAVLLSAGTDGQDGPTDAAGAFGEVAVVAQCAAAGLDPTAYLEDNDSYTLFDKIDGLLQTGLTGTNVMDLVVGLAAGDAGDAAVE